ncbi:MAG: hypothetical protein B6D37_01385 [Sphingobacteriales bacterium UTBCD1]|nr:MAG: hypothetical protein B6D37_01385 [Sphingobacteriales bacterium UTBCD1]
MLPNYPAERKVVDRQLCNRLILLFTPPSIFKNKASFSLFPRSKVKLQPKSLKAYWPDFYFTRSSFMNLLLSTKTF